MKNVAVIIVNYNVTNEVVDCLNSINKYFSGIPLEIIVIDNNSSDKSLIDVSSKYANVKFIFSPDNLGYSKANSLGVKSSVSEYLFFINPDTIIIEDFITPILNFIESNPITGVCGPMLLYKDKSYQNSAGDTIGFWYETAEAFMFINYYRKIKKIIKRKNYSTKEPFEVGWVSGACMIVKRKVYEEVGGFSSEYFLNYEDIDLCARIKKAGYKNYYFPYFKCVHLDQTSQKRNYKEFVYSRYVSRIIYSKNNYGFIKRFLVRFIHIIGLLLRILFVNILYKDVEKKQRKEGYKQALKLYLG